MAILEVKNPFTNKIEKVNFSGDDPTQEEMDSLYTMFQEETKKSSTEIDLSTASSEEIQEYVRKKKQLGIDPVSGEKIAVEDKLKDPGVDYTSGLQDFRIRAGFANKEKDSEKAAYLADQVGKDGFRQDKGGRFIITKKGREKLNMPDGPEFAVDEEGFSLKYDTADFLGEAGVPLAVGIGASILTGGMATIPAIAIVGGATATGKILDEAFEAAQGYQRQTAGEIAKDVAWEGVFGATGEGVGRGLSALFGRLFKGSASKTAEESKEIGREMRQLGIQPTVEGGAPGAFGILTRLQAVYEGISPNKKAAENNVKAILQELRGLKGFDTNEEAIEALGKTIQDDIQKLYSSFDEALGVANKSLNKEIERDIARIMEPLKKANDVGKEAVDGLTNAKNIFNENIDFLYKKVDQSLGSNNEIIPFGFVQTEIDKLLKPLPRSMKRDLAKGTEFDNTIKAIRKRAIDRLSSSKIGRQALREEDIIKNMYARPEEAFFLQKILSEIDFANGPKAFGVIKASVDESFDRAEDLMEQLLARHKMFDTDVIPPNTLSVLGDPRIDPKMRFGNDPVSMRQLKEGLTNLRKTRQHYAKGIAKFNSVAAQNIIKSTRTGRLELDPSVILNKVIKKNQPRFLEKLFSSRRGVKFAFEKLDPEPRTIPFGERDITLDKAQEILDSGILSKQGNRKLRQRLNQAVQEEEAIATERARGGLQGEELRQTIASAFLKDALERSTVNGVVDGVQFAKIIDDIGTTKNVLFKSRVPPELARQRGLESVTGELDDINELTSILRSKATELDDSVIQNISNQPLATAIKEAKRASLELDAMNKQTYLKSLRDKDASKIVDTIFTKNNGQSIKAFMNNSMELRTPGTEGFDRVPKKIFDDVTVDATTGLTPHQSLVDQVQEAAMGRILRSLGDVNSPMFHDDFISGRLGGKLKTTLEGYGKDSLNAMFGEAQADKLMKLSEIMIRASDKPLAGKGGLAAPSIALGLSIFGLMTAPLQTIGALAFYTGMSRALRSGPVLDIMLASRKPGADKLGQAFQTMHTINSQFQTQAVTSDEGPFKLTPEAQRSVQQTMAPVRSAIPNVAPAFAGTQAANVDPTNPIVNPNPQSQALAQVLASR
jgi:hypothetical protein